MTTLAYRNGILAGDTQVDWTAEAGGNYCGFETKIFKGKRGLVATSGLSAQGWDYINWFLHGQTKEPVYADDDEALDFHVIVIKSDGSMWKGENGDALREQIGNFIACGSGYKCAMAAMEMGASAEEAVRVSMKYDPATGGEVQTLTLA